MIRTRGRIPGKDPAVICGDGSELFGLTIEQVRVIASYLSISLLSSSPHGDAVFDLIVKLEDKYGCDFLDEACEETGMEVCQLVDIGNSSVQVIPNDRVLIEFHL